MLLVNDHVEFFGALEYRGSVCQEVDEPNSAAVEQEVHGVGHERQADGPCHFADEAHLAGEDVGAVLVHDADEAGQLVEVVDQHAQIGAQVLCLLVRVEERHLDEDERAAGNAEGVPIHALDREPADGREEAEKKKTG